jgi:hypothetical protein
VSEVSQLPYDCGRGREGDRVQGIRCPTCGGVEHSPYLLSLNHGWDPDIPGRKPWNTDRDGCRKHVAYARRPDLHHPDVEFFNGMGVGPAL